LRTAVAKAQPFLGFRVDRALRAADLRSPEGRARAAEAALAMVAEHPNQLVREQYVGTIAASTNIPAEQLVRSIGRRGARPVVRPVNVSPGSAEGPEVEALRLAVHRPEDVADRLTDAMFDDEVHVAVYRALANAATLHDAIDAAPPEAGALLQRLAVEETEAEPDDVIALLLRQIVGRLIDAEAKRVVAGNGDAATVGWLKIQWDQLRPDSSTRIEASEALVAFLAERSSEEDA
jgi:DNA primase